MSHLDVHARKIRKLTLTKKHIASIAWELDLCAMRKLSSSSYKVWHLIRAFAAFDKENYSTTLSQEFLAEQLYCSTKTISRAINEIKAAGFLNVKNNISKATGTTANTYFIIFPEEAYKNAEAQSDKNSPLPSMAIDIDNLDITNNNQTTCKAATTETKASVETGTKHQDNLDTSISISTANTVNSDDTPLDKNDVHNRDCNFREKNNKAVVVNFIETDSKKIENTIEAEHKQLSTLLSKLNNQKQDLQNKLKQSRIAISDEDRLAQLKQALRHSTSQETKTSSFQQSSSELLKQIDRIDLQLEQYNHHYQLLTNKLNETKKRQRLTLNPKYVNEIEGDRKLTDTDMALVSNKILAFGLSNDKSNQLINEVVFETRFGSLVKNNQTQRENSIKRAINIGCKLIREGQWSTPTNLELCHQ